MGVIAFLILGLAAGAGARAFMPDPDPGGIVVTMVIGAVGALVGGGLAAAVVGARPVDHLFHLATWIAALAGALVALAIYRIAVVGAERGRRTAY